MSAQCEHRASQAVLRLNMEIPSTEDNCLLRVNRPLSVNAVNHIKMIVYFAQIYSLIKQQVSSFVSFKENLFRNIIWILMLREASS